MNDGSALSWADTISDSWQSGDSSKFQAQLYDVKKLIAGNRAFYAIKTDNSVVYWGSIENSRASQTNVVANHSVVLNPPS